MNLSKKILAFLIVLLSVVFFWPVWPSRHDRELSLFLSARLLLILAAIYGTLVLADYIRDLWKKGML